MCIRRKRVGKLQLYDKDLDYSYAPGIFPAMECLLHAPEQCLRLLISEKSDRSEGIRKLCELAETHHIRIETADRMLSKLSKKENCFAAAVFRKTEKMLNPDRRHVVLQNPGDAGNLGTILRTALGFGYEDVAIICPAVDSDAPHVVRASMGAMFSLNVHHFESFDAYREAAGNRQMFPFMLDASVPPGEAVARKGKAFSLIFGNEATGLPEAFSRIGVPVRIPHSGRIDSLNLSVAAAIGMYLFSVEDV